MTYASFGGAGSHIHVWTHVNIFIVNVDFFHVVHISCILHKAMVYENMMCLQ